MWREQQWWQPWANTLLYLPLESDVVDQSGKTWRTFSTSWITYTTVWWVKSAHVWTTWWILLTAPYPLVTTSTTEQTISFIYYTTTQQSTARRMLFEFRVQNNESIGLLFYENTSNFMFSSDNYNLVATIITNSWTHVACVCSSAWRYIYVNWQLASSWTWTSTPRWNRAHSYQQNQAILCWRSGLNTEVFNWNMREIILEDKAWTADEVANYSTRIKGQLWIN